MTGSAIEAWTVALLRFNIGEVQEGGSRIASANFTFDGKRHCDLSRRWTLQYFLIRLGRCRRGVVGLHLRILRFS